MDHHEAKGEGLVVLKLRVPSAMKADLAQLAHVNERSLNREARIALREHVAGHRAEPDLARPTTS